MICYLCSSFAIYNIRIMKIVQISSLYRYNRLIKCCPIFYSITKQFKAFFSILCICFYYFFAFPTTLLLHTQRHIKVIQIDYNFNVIFYQFINDIIIKFYCFSIDFSFTFWYKPTPLYRCSKRIVSCLL